MNRRYKITRTIQDQSEQIITLEECKSYFNSRPDFTYTNVFTVKGPTSMSVEGEFFMWIAGDTVIPFRHYEGEIYVSGTNDAVIPTLHQVAEHLGAQVVEG